MRKQLLIATLITGFSTCGSALAEQSSWSGFKQESNKVWGEVKKDPKKTWKTTKKDSRAAAKEIGDSSKGMWQALKGAFK